MGSVGHELILLCACVTQMNRSAACHLKQFERDYPGAQADSTRPTFPAHSFGAGAALHSRFRLSDPWLAKIYLLRGWAEEPVIERVHD